MRELVVTALLAGYFAVSGCGVNVSVDDEEGVRVKAPGVDVKVNEKDGVLLLSRTAGSYEQLKDGAIPISPADIEETANALYRAITMSAQERTTRAATLRSVVEGQDAAGWLRGQVSDLSALALEHS